MKTQKRSKKGDGAKISSRDVDDAVDFCNAYFERSLHKDAIELSHLSSVCPTEFMRDVYTPDQEFGWLREVSEECWADELNAAEMVGPNDQRDYERIVKLYRDGSMPPAIQIDGLPCDGFGRAVFHHGIGEDMPVAVFKSKTKKK